MRITIEHYRAMRVPNGKPYCVHARKFAHRYGINWRDFVKNGVDEKVLVDSGDAMAMKLVEKAREMEAERGNGQ